MKNDNAAGQWQLVVIAWGEKYPISEINYLIRNVAEKSPGLRRATLLTDRERPGLAPEVETRRMPERYLAPEMRDARCLAKLCMFEKGLIPADLPAIYLDLDTAVFGDIGILLSLFKTPRTIAMLQSVALPFGGLARLIYRITGKRRYARGNSSILLFHPGHCGYVSEEFWRYRSIYPAMDFKPMCNDERFISWIAQNDMVKVPNHVAVKFPTEYMMPWAWLARLRQAIPATRRRREGLIAVTMPGYDLKPSLFLGLRDGEIFVDYRGRVLDWSDAAIGSMRHKITAYYKALIAQGGTMAESGVDKPY